MKECMNMVIMMLTKFMRLLYFYQLIVSLRAVENQEAARRNFLTDMRDQDDRKQEEQRRKDRQEEERLDRQTRQEQLNTTMQTVQLKLLSDLVSKPTGALNFLVSQILILS